MKWLVLIILLLLNSLSVFAQSAESSELEVEALYDSFDDGETKALKKAEQESTQAEAKKKEQKFDNLSDLVELSPFGDIAVIQKRFLPKTERFELSASLANSLNNAFFNNFGATFRGAYYFNEKYAVELMYYLLQDSKRDITENLFEKQSVDTESVVVPKNFMGVSFKWSPIYGKMALFNETIVPFDIYFAAGYGLSEAVNDKSASTAHLGTGQIFSLSKSMAFRWDFMLNYYRATVLDNKGVASQKNQVDLFISLGMSFYFPEAGYR